MSCSDMKGQPTPTLRSRTILRGVGRTVWRVCVALVRLAAPSTGRKAP